MEKLNMDMPLMDMMVVMSEGNPGAATVLVQIMNEDPIVGIVRIMELDELDIRGHKIWGLYKDCCGQNMDKFFRTLEFLKRKAYTQEEIDLNFELPRSIPFMSDDIKEEEYADKDDDGFCGPWSEKWNEFVQAHRATIIPRLEQFKQEFGDGGLKF